MLLTYGLLALSTSIDSIGIGIAYGIREIKISKIATVILMAISFVVSSFAILVGKLSKQILPPLITNYLGGLILIIMGIVFLFQVIRKPESYDIDKSKHIDSREAISLGIALSLDSFSIGIGTGILSQNAFLVFPTLVSIFQMLFLSIGIFLGSKLKKISTIPSFFWNILSGILLIIIGIITIT